MKLTTYGHACFTLEQDGQLLVVDPGTYTPDFGAPEAVAAIVVTHAHPDHFDPAAIGALVAHNPDVVILAPSAVTAELGDKLPNRTMTAGSQQIIGPFQLTFGGGQHATIHESVTTSENITLLVNDKLYYPGDSFTLPDSSVEVLALPVAAPWLKIAEVIDFLTQVRPQLAFPTHDAILSQTGQQLVDSVLVPVAQRFGSKYRRLAIGESIEV